MRPGAEWRIHVGAHKTGTTHLQDSLAAGREALLARGVDYVALEEFRQLWSESTRRRVRPGRPLPRRLAPMLIRPRLARRLQARRAGSPRVVLSEENLLGRCEDLLGLPAYPDPWPLRAVRGAVRGRSVTLFLSIRDFSEVLPGAYVQCLRRRPASEVRPLFERVHAAISDRPPSWLPLIEHLRRLWPGAGLRIWRQEDYRAAPRRVVRAFLGCDPGPLPHVPAEPRTLRPTAAAVARAEAQPPGADRAAWVSMAREILTPHPEEADAAPYQPFTEGERARLAERYAEDAAAIRRCHPGMMIEAAAP